MPTPNWDILHLRFSSMVRDDVTVATADGKDVKKADRETYLNYGWTKYVNLFALSYRRRSILLEDVLRQLVKSTSLTFAAGIATLPTDFGYYIRLVKATAFSITFLDDEMFEIIKGSNSGTGGEVYATTQDPYCRVTSTQIQLIPVTMAGTDFNLAYVIKPTAIVQGSTIDIPLTEEHWQAVLLFAAYRYYSDKQEFAIANSMLEDAYNSAPYPLLKNLVKAEA